MIEFLEAAEEEFLEAIDRYEEKQEGLGARFLAEVERASDRLGDLENGTRSARCAAAGWPARLTG